MSQVLRALGHHHHHLGTHIDLCLHSRHKEEESTRWTNTPESSDVLSEGNTTPRLTFPLLGIAVESVLAMKEKGQPNSSVRELCSSSNCKNIPEFSAICCYSGFTGFLKMRASALPAMFCSRRTEGNHLSQSFSLAFPGNLQGHQLLQNTSGEQ